MELWLVDTGYSHHHIPRDYKPSPLHFLHTHTHLKNTQGINPSATYLHELLVPPYQESLSYRDGCIFTIGVQQAGFTWGCCCCLDAQSFLTLYNPMDCSPPGCSVHEISQAKILDLLLQGIYLTQGLNPRLLHWWVDSFP